MLTLPDSTIAAKFVIKTHYLMRVVAFHPETQTVDLIQDTYEFANSPYGTINIENEFGQYVTVMLKQPDMLYDVPVKQLRWGQFEIQCCPVPGDTGYIEVFTNDIRDWVANGSNSVPWSDNHFMKECCVFVPFIPNHKNAAKDYPADNTRLVIKSAHSKLEFVDNEKEVSINTVARKININAQDGIKVEGNIEVKGDISVTGAVSVDGTISATQNIKSDTDVIGGGVSLKTHVHTSAAPGSPTSTPIPQQPGA